jgi:hypothetical protein
MVDVTPDPYIKVITYCFKAGGVEFAVVAFSATSVEIEETAKNGQEDTHFYGNLTCGEDGQWTLEEYSRERLERYEGAAVADAIEDFFNQWGPPLE